MPSDLALAAASVGGALAGGLAGELLRRRLNQLHYRNADETGRPDPGARHWVVPALAAVIGLLVWRSLSAGRPEHLLFLVPFAIATTWLVAVDLDVKRLPYRVTLPATIVVAVGVGTAAMLGQDPMLLILTSLAGGVLTWMAFRILHALSKGGLGYGDVRYAALVGLTTGTISLTAAWWAIAIAALTAATWALIARTRGSISYGPWLALGAVAAAVTG